MSRTPFRFIFLGAPGVGKGTFASRIGPALGIITVGVGDLVRDEIGRGTAVGKEVQGFSDQGKLVPDAVINEMVHQRLELPDARNGFILDGYPRNSSQAAWLDTIVMDDLTDTLYEGVQLCPARLSSWMCLRLDK